MPIIEVMEERNFDVELQKALSKKQEWYNSECLQELLSQYRLLHTCVKNLYESFVKKSLIQPDPYRLDKKISQIVVPESTPFAESDIPNIFGERFFADLYVFLSFLKLNMYHFKAMTY